MQFELDSLEITRVQVRYLEILLKNSGISALNFLTHFFPFTPFLFTFFLANECEDCGFWDFAVSVVSDLHVWHSGEQDALLNTASLLAPTASHPNPKPTGNLLEVILAISPPGVA